MAGDFFLILFKNKHNNSAKMTTVRICLTWKSYIMSEYWQASREGIEQEKDLLWILSLLIIEVDNRHWC